MTFGKCGPLEQLSWALRVNIWMIRNRQRFDIVPIQGSWSPRVVSISATRRWQHLRSFAEMICAASIIVTNRLHVAIPAAILGKVTYLADAGYQMLSGVDSQSLATLPTVTFIPRLP